MTIQIQCVLYKPEPGELNRLLDSLATLESPEGVDVCIVFGDSTPDARLEREWPAGTRYEWFGANLGFGAGHNRLFKGSSADHLLLLNPDCVVPYHLITRLWAMALAKPDWGIVEARQIPLEHPKAFDLATGETSWSSGCCALVNGAAFRQVGGFDEVFFMYGEDVDLSWRIRGEGAKCYYCIDTCVYHGKELNLDGIVPTQSELVWGQVANLLLLEKYKRPSLVREKASQCEAQVLRLFTERRERLGQPSNEALRCADIGPKGEFGGRRWEYVGT